jgi:hypothetical protein
MLAVRFTPFAPERKFASRDPHSRADIRSSGHALPWNQFSIAAFSNNAGSVDIKQSAMLPAELLFEIFGQRHERGSTIVTSNLPFEEWTSVFGNRRLTGALLDCVTHHVHILELNGETIVSNSRW